jgi:ATP-dependent helicase/nuclease subunit A
VLEPRTSPLDTHKEGRFLRGTLAHKLLQILPSLADEGRKPWAVNFLQKNAATLSETEQESLLHEIFAVLEHPEFSFIFGPGSMAEVPFTGLLENNQRVSGQIDRLLITRDDIYILDFKTSNAPPPSPGSIPQAYREQLRLYGAVLGKIYPQRTVRCALLWTQGPVLMPIDCS